MPYAETERGMIWYADHRDPTLHRPVTVIIHGAGGTHLDWPAEIRRLPELNAVILDLPGHGRSAGSGRNSIGAYASDVLGFMAALKLDKAILAGHSMGGAIAQTITLQHPARVIGLILIGTSAKLGVHPDLLNGMVNEFKRTVNVLVSLYYGTRPNESMVRRSQQRLSDFNPVTLYNDYVACNAFDLREQLHAIVVPTLIIGGSDDRMTPYKASSLLNERIAGSRLVQIDGGGHMMMLEQPEIVAEAIREWLMAQTF